MGDRVYRGPVFEKATGIWRQKEGPMMVVMMGGGGGWKLGFVESGARVFELAPIP